MKKFIIILSALAVLFSSCTKESLPTIEFVTNSPAINIRTNLMSYNWHGDNYIFHEYRPWYVISTGTSLTLSFMTEDKCTNPDALYFDCTWNSDNYKSNRNGFDASGVTVKVTSNRFEAKVYEDCTIMYTNDEDGIEVIIRGSDWNVMAIPPFSNDTAILVGNEGLTYIIDVMEDNVTKCSVSLKDGMSFSSSAYFTPDTEYTVVLRSPIEQSTVYLYNHGTLLLSLNNQNHNEVKVLGKELNPFVVSLTSFKVGTDGALIKE